MMRIMFEDLKRIGNNLYRRYVDVVAYGILGVSVGACTVAFVLLTEPYWISLVQQKSFDESAVPTSPALVASEPTRISIPKLNIEANFEAPLGIAADKTIEVPKGYTTVGWYKYGPTPGEIGPAVVIGHIDSYQGPAIFHELKNLVPGDRIFIDRKDGNTAEFEVLKLEYNSQSNFPTKQVYGDIEYAGLRLITCTGMYDHGTLRYSHNLIVYGKLVGP